MENFTGREAIQDLPKPEPKWSAKSAGSGVGCSLKLKSAWNCIRDATEKLLPLPQNVQKALLSGPMQTALKMQPLSSP